AVMSAAFLGIYLVACCFRPWLSILPFTVFGAIVLTDRWTAFRRVTLPLRLAAGTTILLALVIACWYAKWWMAAMTLPLAGVILVNFRFYKFFVAHRGLLFAAAVLPMHVLYYLYSSAVFAIGTIVYRFSAAPAGDMPAHS